MNKLAFFVFCYLLSSHTHAQPTQWNRQKEGTWRLENYLPEKPTHATNGVASRPEDHAFFKKNVATLAEWFHQNHPMLKSLKGYDLRAIANTAYAGYSNKQVAENSIPGSLGFLFELYYADGGKWKVEPPQYGFQINAVSGGHGGFFFTPESVVDDGSRYDLALFAKVSDALDELRKYFVIFPLKERPSPGVDVYEAYREGWQKNGRRNIVVYNPERPSYWLPVTVKEMADAHLAYYSLIQKREIDRMILDELKKEIAELTSDELAAPAFAGHDTHFVLKVNGKGQGLQIMRFNPAYWDKSLPISAIQLMTFWDPCLTPEEMAEQENRNYPNYPQLFVNQLRWGEIAGLIMKAK